MRKIIDGTSQSLMELYEDKLVRHSNASVAKLGGRSMSLLHPRNRPNGAEENSSVAE